MATETALPKVGREVEQFKFTVAGLDGESFKREVARIAAAQSGNLGLRDAVADVAAGEFGEVGRETVLRIWQEARARAAAPKVEVLKRRKLPPDGERVSAAAEPKPKAEPEEEAQPQEEAWAIPEFTKSLLVRKAPMDNAKAFARDRLAVRKGNLSALNTYFWRGQWWQWNGASYEPAGDQRIWDMVSNYLNDAKVRSGDEIVERFRPETKHVNELVKFLRTCVAIDERDEPPNWIDGRASPNPAELLAFRNCLVNVRTGETFGHDPRLWVHDGLPFNYPDKPHCPKWKWFLEDIHPGDDDAQMSIEEWLGYGMTWDNRFEKIAVWVGEPRSGRGTIARIQELLVGPRYHIPLNFHTWNSTENSKGGMAGKKVGIFHDVRLKDPKQWGNVAFDPGGLDVKSIEALLKFSSGDSQEIKQMWKPGEVTRPKIKFSVLTNKILNLNDLALLSRLFLLYFGQSRLDKEDKALKLTVLPSEIEGIAWHALAGYRRLVERDRLLVPASGQRLVTQMRERQSHWFKFMNQYWQPASSPGEGVRVKVFNAVFRYWAKEEGRIDQLNANEGALIRGVREIKEWQHLEWFRQGSEERQYPCVFKPGAVSEDMAKTIKIFYRNKETGVTTSELAHELLGALRK